MADGEWERLRAEAEQSRAAKQAGVPKAEKAEERSRHMAGRSASPKTEANKNTTAAKLAKEAGVSQRTMERAMSRISTAPGVR